MKNEKSTLKNNENKKRIRRQHMPKVGDLVRVRTKHYGEKLGVIIEIDKDGIHIKPQAHPRNILATEGDVKVLVSA